MLVSLSVLLTEATRKRRGAKSAAKPSANAAKKADKADEKPTKRIVVRDPEAAKVTTMKPEPPEKAARSPKSPKKTEPSQAAKKQQSRQNASRDRGDKARKADKDTADAIRADRQAQKAALSSLAQRRASGQPVPPGIHSIPAQIAHCMMAVHVKRRKSKQAAWNICRWAMTKYGYLKGPYRINTKLPKATVQTHKGTRRSFQHGMEKKRLDGGIVGNGASKFAKFMGMFKSLEPKITPKQKGA